MAQAAQTTLLRIVAFLVDALTMALVLILPASLASLIAVIGGWSKAIQFVWIGAVGFLMIGVLFRDGYHGRSPGKRLLGLRLLTPRGEGCGYGRSVARNLPLVIFPWNLVELVLVIGGKPRTGDRLAQTTVTEE